MSFCLGIMVAESHGVSIVSANRAGFVASFSFHFLFVCSRRQVHCFLVGCVHVSLYCLSKQPNIGCYMRFCFSFCGFAAACLGFWPGLAEWPPLVAICAFVHAMFMNFVSGLAGRPQSVAIWTGFVVVFCIFNAIRMVLVD